jgi:FeS assembly protein IscX
MSLNWETTYGVALALRRLHPKIDLENVTLGQVHAWTTAIPEFHDDLALVNDAILESIYQEWYEVIIDDRTQAEQS